MRIKTSHIYTKLKLLDIELDLLQLNDINNNSNE